jgi:hypothetical protein
MWNADHQTTNQLQYGLQYSKNKDKRIIFIYFKSAFGSVSHKRLFNKLLKIDFDKVFSSKKKFFQVKFKKFYQKIFF